MIKEEIIHLSSNLYEEALRAKSYFEIIKQFQRNQVAYNEQMNLSPAFYRLTYSALNDALIMSLAKLYDNDPDSLRFDTLKDECINGNTFRELFHASRKQEDGNLLINHTIKEDEEFFFEKEIEASKATCERLGIPYFRTTLQLSLDEYFTLISKKKQSLSRVIKSLRDLRNKVFAHNDKVINFDYDKIFEKNGLKHKMVEALIELAMEFSGFCYTCLTDKCKADSYLNIDDWNQTLYYVELGQIYRNKRIEEWEKIHR